jgi:hypothetical protein
MANMFSAFVLWFCVASFGSVVDTWSTYVPAVSVLGTGHHLLWYASQPDVAFPGLEPFWGSYPFWFSNSKPDV